MHIIPAVYPTSTRSRDGH